VGGPAAALRRLFTGGNIGKQLVKIVDEHPGVLNVYATSSHRLTDRPERITLHHNATHQFINDPTATRH
jgi:hypothetical protein